MNQLSWSTDNQKLRKLEREVYERENKSTKVISFSIPSGYEDICLYARDCRAYVEIQDDGKFKLFKDKNIKYRCYSASEEVRKHKMYYSRLNNFNVLNQYRNNESKLTELLNDSLNRTHWNCDIIRIHVGGEFFSQQYFNAWLNIARLNPHKRFYSYTKSLPLWINKLKEVNNIPNLELIASRGGTHDHLINEYNLKNAVVVYSTDQAKKLNLKIDTSDYLACYGKANFALLIHGTQPKNINNHIKKLEV